MQDHTEKLTVGVIAIIISCLRGSMWDSSIMFATAVNRATASLHALSDTDLGESSFLISCSHA